MVILALCILALTVTLSLLRPSIGRFRIEPAGAAILGAILTLAAGLLQKATLFRSLQFLSMPILTIISLMVITLVAERAGFFRLIAWRIAKAANGNGIKLFTYLFFTGTITGTLFTNDAAVLIFTPMVFELIEEIEEESWRAVNKIPYYFAVLYVANLVGAFIISNPINIVVSRWFHIGFVDYAHWMMLPAVMSMVITYFGMRVFFRRSIPKKCRVEPKTKPKMDNRNFLLTCGLVLLLVLFGFFTEQWTGISVAYIAAAGALVLIVVNLTLGRGSLMPVIKGVGWDVIIFVIGIFIVVNGLRTTGFTDIIGDLIMKSLIPGINLTTYVTGFIGAGFSAIMNNHPVADMMAMAIRDLPLADTSLRILAFSALIGGDLGPKMLPIGSLAALMWFRILRNKGVDISYGLYIKIGIPVTLLAILFSMLLLNLEYLFF
jgi:arsenical pump membrane protein